MEDIQKRVGVGQSSISRHCSRLGPGLTPRDPGWGLVEAYEDPEYRRRKLVQLTPRGKVLIQEIAKATERMVR
jgi:DNA-binding MarR family transcriptional regulator